MTKTGVGARLRRKEDDRFLHGRGQYIGDIRFPRMREVAFVRSPVAHARLTGIRIPEHLRSSVFTSRDMTDVRAIRAVSPLPGFQASEQPPLVTDKIRHVGELIAMCVADTRAEAEDIAAQVIVEYEELPAVVDMLKAQEPGSALVHDTVKRNIYLEVGFDGPVEAAAKTAPVKVTRELRTARQVMSPIECRGFIAQWDAELQSIDPAWRDPVPPCRSHRPGAGSANSRNPNSRCLAGCGRRFRLQGNSRGGGNLPLVARDTVRRAGAMA